MGKGGNLILKPHVIWVVRTETPASGTCRGSSFARGLKVSIYIRKWRDLSERKAGAQGLCSWLMLNFRAAQGFRRAGKGGNRVRSRKGLVGRLGLCDD